MKIEGVFPPVTTPFDDSGCIEYKQPAGKFERWNETDISGYLILGCNSEVVFLHEDEKIEIVKTARKSMPQSKKMLVGTGLEGTGNTIAFTNKAAMDLFGYYGGHARLPLLPVTDAEISQIRSIFTDAGFL